MSAPFDLLFLLFAWVAIVGLFVVVPWATVRLAVRILEMDVWTPESERVSVDHEHDETPFTTTKPEEEGRQPHVDPTLEREHH
ncbi:hypothetical protein [Haladaptatus sp. NG-SE-30]